MENGDEEQPHQNHPDETTTTPVVLTETVALPRSGGTALVVTLNRPRRFNCFNVEVCEALARIFGDLADRILRRDSGHDDDDPALPVAVVLTGAGPSFCAGADLSQPPNPLAQSSDAWHDLMRNPVHQMSRVTVPILGALRGHCITGGFELALACDVLIGDTTTRFQDTHVKFGLAPCWGLSQRLQRRVGPGRAKLLSFTARPLGAEQARRWGLLDELVDEAKNVNVVTRALELADEMGANDAVMVRRYKRALVEGGLTDLHHGLRRERELALTHYLEATGNGVLDDIKGFIEDENRPRSRL